MRDDVPLPAFGALTGLTVIDRSGVLGRPYCRQILAGHGARFIEVEPPAGNEARAWGRPLPTTAWRPTTTA